MAIKDKLQKLLKKVTNKDIKGDNIEEVIADAEAKYEGGGAGGSTVVANPTLAGDEAELTGLEVDGTKYKVPSGGSSSLGLKYQDTKDVVDFVYTDIYSKLGDTADTIYLDTSKLKQILIKAGVDLNQPFYDSGSGDSGMDVIDFIFTLSYTKYDDTPGPEHPCYHLFKEFKLTIYVYLNYGDLSDIRIQDEKGDSPEAISLTDVTGLTTWEDLLNWMIENNKNLKIGKVRPDEDVYWGKNIYAVYSQDYNWSTYPTFSTVYIDNRGDDPYRGEPLYVDIQDLKDALIYEYEE